MHAPADLPAGMHAHTSPEPPAGAAAGRMMAAASGRAPTAISGGDGSPRPPLRTRPIASGRARAGGARDRARHVAAPRTDFTIQISLAVHGRLA